MGRIWACLFSALRMIWSHQGLLCLRELLCNNKATAYVDEVSHVACSLRMICSAALGLLSAKSCVISTATSMATTTCTLKVASALLSHSYIYIYIHMRPHLGYPCAARPSRNAVTTRATLAAFALYPNSPMRQAPGPMGGKPVAISRAYVLMA